MVKIMKLRSMSFALKRLFLLLKGS